MASSTPKQETHEISSQFDLKYKTYEALSKSVQAAFNASKDSAAENAKDSSKSSSNITGMNIASLECTTAPTCTKCMSMFGVTRPTCSGVITHTDTGTYESPGAEECKKKWQPFKMINSPGGGCFGLCGCYVQSTQTTKIEAMFKNSISQVSSPEGKEKIEKALNSEISKIYGSDQSDNVKTLINTSVDVIQHLDVKQSASAISIIDVKGVGYDIDGLYMNVVNSSVMNALYASKDIADNIDTMASALVARVQKHVDQVVQNTLTDTLKSSKQYLMISGACMFILFILLFLVPKKKKTIVIANPVMY